MSDRQNWSRLVAFIFVFAFVTLTLGLRVDAQGSFAAPVEATVRDAAEEKAQKDFIEELLPYSTQAFAIDTSANIISAGTYPFTTQTSVALEDMSSGTTQLVAARALAGPGESTAGCRYLVAAGAVLAFSAACAAAAFSRSCLAMPKTSQLLFVMYQVSSSKQVSKSNSSHETSSSSITRTS